MDELDLQLTLAKPGQVTHQGQTLAQMLAGDAGLDALKLLANGGEAGFQVKLAAALLVARAEGWTVYRAPSRKATKAASKAGPVSPTGKLLEAAAREANRVVSHKATLAVLQCALVVQAEGVLAIAGTDMSTTMIVRLPAGGPDLRAAVNGRELQAAFKAAGKQEVSLTADDDGFTVHGGGKSVLRTEPVEELPMPELGPVLANATLSLPHLAGVARGAAGDESRPTLTCVFIGHEMRCKECGYTQMAGGRCWKCSKEMRDLAPEVEPLEAVMVTADGFRMAFCGVTLPPEFPNVLLPATAVNEMLKAVDGDQVVVAIHGSVKAPETPRYAVMRCGARNKVLAKAGAEVEVIATLLTEGTFPHYKQIIPNDEQVPRSFRAGTQDLADAAKAISPVAKEAADIAFVQTEAEGLRVRALTSEQVAERVVTVSDVSDPALLALNVNFLADIGESLAALGAVVVAVRSGAPAFRDGWWYPNTSPYRFDGPITWVIMPMHVQTGVAWQGADPGPALEYAEPLARKALTEAAEVLGYALTPAHTDLATEAMASTYSYDLLTAVEAAGWLDALRAKAQEVARAALDDYKATHLDLDGVEVTDDLIVQTADKMLRTSRGLPLKDKLRESKALAAAGWK